MRKPSNPFIVAGYHSPTYFCDREEGLEWLWEQFTNERNSVLYSWKRIGKTALVRHFFYQLEKENRAEGLFVDLSGTTCFPEAINRFLTSIINRFGELKNGIGSSLQKLIGSLGAIMKFDPLADTPQINFGYVPGQSVTSSLDALGGYLAEKEKQVIVCIDEIQYVRNYPETDAEATFQKWMMDFPVLRFVICGNHMYKKKSALNKESRPFNRNIQMLQLDPLPRETYAEFIQSHFSKVGKFIDPPYIKSIFNWTRVQTFYVQLVCNKLYDRTDRIYDEILEEVFMEIMQQEIPVFASYQPLLTSFQWKLLVALAKAETVENPMSHSFLIQFGLGAASSVNSALQALIKKEFVIYQDHQYTLHDTLLMRWLQGL